MPEYTYAQAVNEALRMTLAEDERTLLFGEDVAKPGGVFGVTKGLEREFGDRVFDTPISESAILGGAIGAAMMGLRPIVEIMWIDFTLVALDQIVNQAANVRYVTNGRLTAPITIRTQHGSMPGACAQHSQSLEALFAHIPGLVVGMPATAQDAFDMLRSAARCEDPTLVIENRNLYHGAKFAVDTTAPVAAPGGASTRREGSDVTVVTWGAMSLCASDAAVELEREGIDVEIIDLRWLRPMDTGAVLRSVEKTGRLVVAHEAHVFGGLGAEVLAMVSESGVPLAAPPVRVGTPPARIPAAPSLQAAIIPDAATIVRALREAVGDPSPTGGDLVSASGTGGAS